MNISYVCNVGQEQFDRASLFFTYEMEFIWLDKICITLKRVIEAGGRQLKQFR